MSHYQVFDAFQDAVLVIDREGCLHYGNSGASILLEVSARRLSTGRPLSQFLSLQPDIASPGETLDAITEMTQSREVEFQLPGGRSGWVQVVMQPEPAGFSEKEGMRWVLTLRDVTLEKTLHSKYKAELDQKESVIADLRAAREDLQKYSEHLEEMVAERTLKLTETNALLKSILDSLGQGILVFDKEGRCLDVYSQVCHRLFGSSPSGKAIEEAIGLSTQDGASFSQWREVVFDEVLDFEDLSPLAPGSLSHRKDLEIALDYHPMRSEEGRISAVVVVATDKTREMKALREAEREHEIAGRVTQVARHKEAFRLFVSETRRILSDMLSWPENALSFEEIARQVHTLKGGAASFFFTEVVRCCDEYETELSRLTFLKERPSREPVSSLVSLARQGSECFEEEIENLTGLLGPVAESGEASSIEVPVLRLQEWSRDLKNAASVSVAKSIGEKILREFTERSVESVIGHLESSLVEMAKGLDKKIERFKVEGGGTPVPLYIARGLIGSLVHAFRNSIYHGVEEPEERLASGKPEGGHIVARFQRYDDAKGARLRIEIEDDGRGVDHEKIRSKLIERGRVEDAGLSPHELAQVILRDDLSTAEQVDSVAGRGVGLAAIANEVKRLGGKIVVRSEPGQGMKLEIEVGIPMHSEEPSAKAGKSAA